MVGGVAAGPGAERNVFDFEGQRKAGPEVRKIVFIGDAGTHGGRGHHEFVAGSILLAEHMNHAYPRVHAVVHSTKNWPQDLAHADAVVVALNHGGRAALDPNIAKAVARGAGFAALHYGVEVEKGEQGNNYLKWIGGYFEASYSVNPWWTPQFKDFPVHPITRGVKPFSLRDEWYYHMRFVPDMKGVTPILSDLPPLDTIQGGGRETSSHGGNPEVWKAVSSGQKQHVAWAYERPDGGRGFGFTGLHLHQNLAEDNFRTLLLNAVAWVSKLEVPEGGVPSDIPDSIDLDKVIEAARASITRK